MQFFSKKRMGWFSGCVLALMLATWFWLRHLESKALNLAQSGRTAITLLGTYAKALREADQTLLYSTYAADFHASGALWRLGEVTTVSGATLSSWVPLDQSLNRDQIIAGLMAWRALMTHVDMGKLKLDAVELSKPNEICVRAVLWFRAFDAAGNTHESQARMRFWLVPDAKNEWHISQQALITGESVTGKGRGFSNVAAEAGLIFSARHNPMFASAAWNPQRFEIFKYSSAGVSAGDYDGDGNEDLFFGDGKQARLFRNLGNGSFSDVTEAVGLPELVGINVGLFLDLDNDGNRDLFLGGLTVRSRFFRNLGNGHFEDVTERSAAIAELCATAAAVDYDNDGDLDLYLGRYLDPRVDLPTTLFYTRNSAGNTLLRNDGDFKFTDVTEAAGVREGGLTLGVAWGDYDNDGDQDLYVANDFGRNALLRNEGNGTFKDVSAESGTLDFGFGMSASFGDVDNDGDLDLYVSNVHSGQRWYGQAATLHQYLMNSMRQGTFAKDANLYREILSYTGSNWNLYGDRMVKGNSLMLNDGKGHFVDAAEEANANPFGWYWGSAFLDYDNDGDLDLYAANGWITASSHEDL